MLNAWRPDRFCTWPMHQENEGNKQQEESAEKAEYSVVGEHAGLLFDHAKHHFSGLIRRADRVPSSTQEHMLQCT